MDREWGSKPGSGGAASAQNEAIDRRERLRRLALETIDLAKDPYFMRNHLGSYECKLCLTLHNNEGNYLAHTQGKRHQTNLAKRAAREAKDAPAQPQPHKRKVTLRKTVKIGRPGYRVTKQYDPETKQRSLLFQIEYPEIEDLMKPRHRFMSSYEQRVQPFDKRYQYLLFAAEPYEIVAFKVFSYFWTFFALCFCLCFCSLLYIFRCPARRLTSPLQISSRTGILTPRCSRYNCILNPSRQRRTNRSLPLLPMAQHHLVYHQGLCPHHPKVHYHHLHLLHKGYLLVHPWQILLELLHLQCRDLCHLLLWQQLTVLDLHLLVECHLFHPHPLLQVGHRVSTWVLDLHQCHLHKVFLPNPCRAMVSVFLLHPQTWDSRSSGFRTASIIGSAKQL
ncbi:uncharacterized protein [Glycine max]|uniref:uncharacterized protein isoform X1 n=1 Tax=Glycine max TaxID=3847 RepID=UPI001B356F60|nr:uncharacterized protein LOC100818114 isoform X1 [Glycine max]